MKSKTFILYILLVAAVVLTGCSNTAISEKAYVASVKPSSLFRGDAKILQPHLGMTGVAVKVTNLSGSEKTVNTKYEIWEKGIG